MRVRYTGSSGDECGVVKAMELRRKGNRVELVVLREKPTGENYETVWEISEGQAVFLQDQLMAAL